MTPKRSLSPASENLPSPKRAKVDHGYVNMDIQPEGDSKSHVSRAPTKHSHARLGLQRSIAMVLKHDGFHSASPEALESFTSMVETCECFSHELSVTQS